MAGYIQGVRAELRGYEEMGKPPRNGAIVNGTDWLAVAIGNIGGVGKAAKVMGVSRQTIYNWLDKGVGTIEFKEMVKLARIGDVPIEYLARRLGPWKE